MPEQPHVDLGKFLDRQGRLRAMPRRLSHQASVLRYLAARFDPARSYTEREVNALLNEWHLFGDPARLRRDMFDAGILDRDPAGTAYRLRVR